MTQERRISGTSGWGMLAATLGVLALAIFLIVQFIIGATNDNPNLWLLFGFIACIPTFILLCIGFYTLQPNQAAVLVLFGSYVGTVRDSGFMWTNPFNSRIRVSLRSHNLNGEKLKVNDKRGNPIEIAAVVVWRVEETAHAVFDVEDYEDYVRIQSESAVRRLANAYPTTTATMKRSSRCGTTLARSPRCCRASCKIASARRAFTSRKRA